MTPETFLSHVDRFIDSGVGRGIYLNTPHSELELRSFLYWGIYEYNWYPKVDIKDLIIKYLFLNKNPFRIDIVYYEVFSTFIIKGSWGPPNSILKLSMKIKDNTLYLNYFLEGDPVTDLESGNLFLLELLLYNQAYE